MCVPGEIQAASNQMTDLLDRLPDATVVVDAARGPAGPGGLPAMGVPQDGEDRPGVQAPEVDEVAWPAHAAAFRRAASQARSSFSIASRASSPGQVAISPDGTTALTSSDDAIATLARDAHAAENGATLAVLHTMQPRNSIQ